MNIIAFTRPLCNQFRPDSVRFGPFSFVWPFGCLFVLSVVPVACFPACGLSVYGLQYRRPVFRFLCVCSRSGRRFRRPEYPLPVLKRKPLQGVSASKKHFPRFPDSWGEDLCADMLRKESGGLRKCEEKRPPCVLGFHDRRLRGRFLILSGKDSSRAGSSVAVPSGFPVGSGSVP